MSIRNDLDLLQRNVLHMTAPGVPTQSTEAVERLIQAVNSLEDLLEALYGEHGRTILLSSRSLKTIPDALEIIRGKP